MTLAKGLIIAGVVALALFMYSKRHISMARNLRFLREIHIGQRMQSERAASFERVERMWRDKAGCATSEEEAEYCKVKAYDARSRRLGLQQTNRE
jgi:hypothetical protein